MLVGNVQGWQCERVVQRDGLSGKILLVLPTDSAPHLKKVCNGNSLAHPLRLPSMSLSSWMGDTVGEGHCPAAGGAAGLGEGLAAGNSLQGGDMRVQSRHVNTKAGTWADKTSRLPQQEGVLWG